MHVELERLQNRFKDGKIQSSGQKHQTDLLKHQREVDKIIQLQELAALRFG